MTLRDSFTVLAAPIGGPLSGEYEVGVDLDHEWFSAMTNFGVTRRSVVPLMWHHDRDRIIRGAIGSATNFRQSERGLLADVTMDTKAPGYRLIKELAEDVELFVSIGSDGSVRRGPRGHLLAWPIRELSLTPTPMNLYARILEPDRLDQLNGALSGVLTTLRERTAA